MLTIADRGGRGGQAIADDCWRGVEGGVWKPPKMADIICGQPLTHLLSADHQHWRGGIGGSWDWWRRRRGGEHEWESWVCWKRKAGCGDAYWSSYWWTRNHSSVYSFHIGKNVSSCNWKNSNLSSESQVLLCLVVCLAAVIFCLQSRYDGDYLGGVNFEDHVKFNP